MRIAFFGSPDFSLPSYRALAASGHDLACVVTRPDAPTGRGRALAPTPVAAAALADGRPLLRPETLNRAFIAELAAFKVDLLAVVAYGRILGPTLLAAYPDRVLNVHPSLLPAFRGASPMQAAILAGLPETGVTIMHLVSALDAGDVILQRRVPLGPRTDIEELHDRLAGEGAQLLLEAIDRVGRGDAPRIPQDEAAATFTAPIEKAAGRIDWSRDAAALDRLVRAYRPWPGAFTTLDGLSLRLHAVEPLAAPAGDPPAPGTLLSADDAGIVVACGAGALRIAELQPETRKRMSAADFLRGRASAGGPVTGLRFI